MLLDNLPPRVELVCVQLHKWSNDLNGYIYFNVEEVVEHCLHQGEDAEAGGDGDDQDTGCLQGLSLL